MKKLCLKIKLISNAAGKVINVFITTALFFIVSMFFQFHPMLQLYRLLIIL
ncbi:MAG: hypothetical protein ACRCZW_06040 [Lactobacillaceae bacterium]